MSQHYSGVKLHEGLPGFRKYFTPEEQVNFIKAEPMFFRAAPEFARKNGSLLTASLLRRSLEIWGSLDGCIIDSRHHMLMPGMYPCIPGWHTDDAPRNPNKWGGQPDIFAPEYETEHLLCVVDVGTESLTEFLIGDVPMPEAHLVGEHAVYGKNFYKTADDILTDRFYDTPNWAETLTVQSGQIAEFNVHSWHRGAPAKNRGFRWFIRITRNSRHQAQNEIRSNAQVYLTDATYGW